LTTGQILEHSSQALHSSASTYRAFLRIFAVKLPT